MWCTGNFVVLPCSGSIIRHGIDNRQLQLFSRDWYMPFSSRITGRDSSVGRVSAS